MLEVENIRRPGIGLTPLIDVVFILLIFFMLVMQFKKYQQMPLAVAKASKSINALKFSDVDVIQITLTNAGQCLLQEKKIDCSQVADSELLKQAKIVLLQFEENVLLSRILDSHQQLSSRGLNVQLATRLNLRKVHNAE